LYNESRQARAYGLRGALVSIGLPVRNGARTIETVVQSVLAQDHERLELIISDNASTDGTEEICRELASKDDRIAYHRHATNVGLLNNFVHTVRSAKGTFFRWIGDDDWLAPNYVSRCIEAFVGDSRLVLVTTQLNYVRQDGSTYTLVYSDKTFCSDDPIVRFQRLIDHLIDDDLPVDPLYALSRRDKVVEIPRENVFREDEVFAAKLALAGPWGHVPEILARQTLRTRGASLPRYLNVPGWQAQVPTIVQCWELLEFLRTDGMTRAQRNEARLAVARLFVFRHYRTLSRRARKLIKLIPRSASR
jgi:glycosyltransferase involved in cell wall biosynthesis